MKPFTVSPAFKQAFDKANEIIGSDAEEIAAQKEDLRSGKYSVQHMQVFYESVIKGAE